MNPLVLIWPAYRASTSAFILGLVVLALVDAARIFVGTGVPVLGFALFWAMMFFVLSLHINRLRYVERSAGMAFLPVGLAFVGKGIAGFIGFMGAIMEAMYAYAEEQGVNVDDANELQQAMSDPGFQQSFQTALESDPDRVIEMISASAMPSFVVFWLIIAIFAIWFAQMRPNGGRIDESAA